MDNLSARRAMRDGTQALSFGTTVRRTLLSIVAPHQVFDGRLDEEGTLRWPLALLWLAGVGLLDVFFHTYLITSRWIFDIFPADWPLWTLGFVCLFVNEWLLGFGFFLLLHRLARRPLRTAAPFLAASWYLVVGLWVIAMLIDTGHLVFHIPVLRIPVPALSWLDSPMFPYTLRLSHVFIFPWVSLSLWMVFRRILRAMDARQTLIVWLSAVTLPLIGRVFIEPLPNLTMNVLRHLIGRHPSVGWSVFLTQAAVMLISTAVVVWLTRTAEGADGR